MKQVLILEDNERTLAALEKAVREISRDILVFPARTYKEACGIALEQQMDLFLLDIILEVKQQGDTSGIKFAQQMRKHKTYLFTPIIFITALADPELYAYRELHCFGYLEKPFSMQRVKDLVEKALEYPASAEEDKIIYLRKDGILFAVSLQKVMYAEAKNHILFLHMETEVLEIPYFTIKKFLKEARGQGFYQCSRNTVINRHYIRTIDIVNRYIGLTVPEFTVEIGPSFCKRFIREVQCE